MPLLPPRKVRNLSYEDQQAKTVNLRRAESLVTHLLDAGNDPEAATDAGRAIWAAAPRSDIPATPYDDAPWQWLRDAAADGYRLEEKAACAKLALAAEVWHVLVSHHPNVEPQSGLRRPDAQSAADLFSTGLGSIVGSDQRYPLFVLRKTTYHAQPLTRLFAERLFELRVLNALIDPGTLLLAETVLRG